MKIDGFGDILPGISQNKNKQHGGGIDSTFSDLMKGINQDQIGSEKAIESFVSGDGIELHEVMIAGEKAKTSLALLTEIKNKTLDMYNQLTKMPI